MVTTRIFTAALFILMLAGTMQTAHAQVDLGGRVGYDLEIEALHLGAEARFEVPSLNLPIEFKPSIDYFFLDNFTFMTFDANAIYHIDLDESPLSPYAGAGLGVSYMSFDSDFEGIGIDGSDTSVGLNLLGGAIFGSGSMRPFAEARFNTDDLFSLTGGVLFRLGQ